MSVALERPVQSRNSGRRNGKGRRDAQMPTWEHVLCCVARAWRANLSPRCSPSFSRPGRLEAVLALAAHLPGHRLPQSLVPAQGLLLRPCGASPLDGDSYSSAVVVALPKLVLAQRLAANITENPAGLCLASPASGFP